MREDILEKIEIADPDEVMFYAVGRRPGRSGGLYLFQFGAYGTVWVAVWQESLEDALEVAAEWLTQNAPGLITSEEEMTELYKEAAEDHGIAWPIEDWDDPEAEEMRQDAEADMTYTESGWLTSYEWYVDELHPGDDGYLEIFEKSVEGLELDDEEWEEVEKTLKKLEGLKRK